MNKLQLGTLVVTLLLTTPAVANDLHQLLQGAKPGETIELPAGEFKGGVTLPPGVSLKGAGFEKTIIDAAGALNGIIVDGGSGATISNLTVRNAQGAAITVRDTQVFTLSRVRATKSAQGIAFKNVTKGRIENCLSDHNSFGIAVSGGNGCVVVNCTVASCSEIALSLAACPGAVAFNNCLVGSATCVNIDYPKDIHLDHNLYFGMFLGQMKEQIGKRMLAAWNYLSGLDTHSVQMPVEFKNLETGDCTPTTVLTWALDRAATGDWGVTEFAGVKAPDSDLFGHPRAGRPDVGAVEVTIAPPRAADGQFTVSSDVGTKSAGVFTKDGILISYLFHNLPLPQGKYSFWLPARDYVGQPIPTGDYEVRLAESDFKWKYLNHVGDNGKDDQMAGTASFNPRHVAFAPNNILVMLQDPSEDHADVRGYDALTGELRWTLDGCSIGQGVAVAQDAKVYVLRQSDAAKGESRLTQLDSATGQVVPFLGTDFGHTYPIMSAGVRSLAALGDRLYTADAAGNKLYVLTMSDGKVERTLDVPSPRYVASDDKNNLLWVVSDSKLLALKPDGTKVAESSAVGEPLSLAASNGQLAVVSSQSGKVHVLDAGDPQNLKPVRELGRGDGPYGSFERDRFFFKKVPQWDLDDRVDSGVALNPAGQLAVVDWRRLSMFDAEERPLWYTIGVFGNFSLPSFSTQSRRLWDSLGEISFLMNEKDGTWKPEAVWDHRAITVLDPKKQFCRPLGDFSVDGKAFMVLAGNAPGFPFGPPAGRNGIPIFVIARLDGFKSVPVLTVTQEGDKAVVREDTNGDGTITNQDTAKPLSDVAGKSVAHAFFSRFRYLEADGSILVMANPPRIWRQTGLNDNGIPTYDVKNLVELPAKNWLKDPSPYNQRTDDMGGPVVVGLLKDGGFVSQVILRSSGGAGLNNGAGTDLAGYGPDGRRRWALPLAAHHGIAGMGTVDDITLTSVFYSVEQIIVDADGLQLGGFCEAPQLHYTGYWIDHPNLQLFKMPDGHLHATIGSNVSGRHNWYRLDNQESLRRTRYPFALTEPKSRELAGLPSQQSKPIEIRPPQPKLHVARLAQPLKIDGDLEKWRKAGIQPSIVIGPSGSMAGPEDSSALVRMAYEGQNLYFQVLQFDDVPTFHQRDLMFMQNAVELALNATFPNGFQFIVYKNPQGQDIVHRHRFFSDIPPRQLTPEHAPRIVRVLPDAQSVKERETLEGLYGVDLSQSKVVVTEFMLTMDKETYAPAEADVIQLGPGKQFWIGFFIDDNDKLYTDAQHLISWPATFGMFSPKEDGAMAVCD